MENYIGKRRRELKLSLSELAGRITTAGYAVSAQSISHWERGRNQPPMHLERFRLAISIALETSIAQMLSDMGYSIRLDTMSDEARMGAQLIESMAVELRQLALMMLRDMAAWGERNDGKTTI